MYDKTLSFPVFADGPLLEKREKGRTPISANLRNSFSRSWIYAYRLIGDCCAKRVRSK